MKRAIFFSMSLACLGLAACSGPAVNPHAQNTFLTSDDMITMTDNMAASMASNPQVAAAAAQKPMVIVMQPIVNETNVIIPAGEKQMYVARIRTLLASKPILRNQFTFVLNKVDYQNLIKTEGISADTPVEAAPEIAAVEQNRFVPEYSLTGRFYAKTNATSTQRSDYYLCEFKLINIATGNILWLDTYETKKHIKNSMLD